MSDELTPGGGMTLRVTEPTQRFLRETKPWVTLMSILTFVGAGLMVLGALAMMALGAAVRNAAGGGVFGGLFGLVYLVFALIYLLPGLYLWRYRTAIGHLLADGSVASLENALKHQRSFWRFVGILTLVMIAFAVLGVIAAIGLGVAAGTMMR